MTRSIVSFPVLVFFQRCLLGRGSAFPNHGGVASLNMEEQSLYMVEQQALGPDLRITLREFTLTAPKELSKAVLYSVRGLGYSGSWLDWPIINPRTMTVVFSAGPPGTVFTRATTLNSIKLVRNSSGSLGAEASSKPSPLIQEHSFRHLEASPIDWKRAYRTELAAVLSDDASTYAVVFSLHSGLSGDLASASDTSRLALLDATGDRFTPLTLTNEEFNDFCVRFMPGSTDSLIFLSNGRKGCGPSQQCAYTLSVSDVGSVVVKQVFIGRAFRNECPEFGKMPLQDSSGTSSQSFVLLMEDVGDGHGALGYATVHGLEFSDYRRLFSVPTVNLVELLDVNKFADCKPTIWNTSGTRFGDILCSSAEQSLVLIDASGNELQDMTSGNFGDALEPLKCNNHASWQTLPSSHAPQDDLASEWTGFHRTVWALAGSAALFILSGLCMHSRYLSPWLRHFWFQYSSAASDAERYLLLC